MGGLEAMGQDPKLFNDPQQFNPDRWATDDIHPFAIILHAFGFGPRGCGMSLRTFILILALY